MLLEAKSVVVRTKGTSSSFEEKPNKYVRFFP